MTITRPELRENVSLADYTTIGLGGPARRFAVCRTEEEIVAALAMARESAWPVLVLGGGSNLLIADRGWDGLVIQVALKGLDFADDTSLVRAAAGEDWDEFVAATVERGWQGLECLSGIPGFVGGTPIQNVGAYGQEVAERIVRVRAIDRESDRAVEFPGDECDFAYRMSRFKSRDAGRYIVSAVTYALRPGGEPEIRYEELKRRLAGAELSGDVARDANDPGDVVARLRTVRETVLALRRGKSMVFDIADPNSRSLGSFFMNPILAADEYARFLGKLKEAGLDEAPNFPGPAGVKVPAAWLIERAGFTKGFQGDGGAAISDKHALALVNRGGSTADVLALASRIQASVRDRFGIELHREPVLIE